MSRGRRSMARRARGLFGPTAAILLLVGIFTTGIGLGQITNFGLRLPVNVASSQGGSSVLAPSQPVSVAIPSIGVQAGVHPVGQAPDGSIEVPPLDKPEETGWYDRGPTPGQYGPAIIVGHVDSRTGPAVFAQLGSVRPGDEVKVTRRDKQVAVFRIDEVSHYAKTNLPTDKVYSDFSKPGLRLITCGGRWVGGETGYAENVIVFASLVSSARA